MSPAHEIPFESILESVAQPICLLDGDNVVRFASRRGRAYRRTRGHNHLSQLRQEEPRAPAAEGVPRCGNCHELLPWLVDADDQSFEAELQTSLPVLVDLWAPWCGPCKWVSPAIEEVATTHKGQLKVIKVNVAGAPSKPDLVAWLEHHLAERVG